MYSAGVKQEAIGFINKKARDLHMNRDHRRESKSPNLYKNKNKKKIKTFVTRCFGLIELEPSEQGE